MAQLIETNGTVKEISPTEGSFFQLEELQRYVGGYIEVVVLGSQQVMVVNEEGKMMGLQRNDVATDLAKTRVLPGDYIAGNAVVCTLEEFEKDLDE